jgi:hypothetical protein
VSGFKWLLHMFTCAACSLQLPSHHSLESKHSSKHRSSPNLPFGSRCSSSPQPERVVLDPQAVLSSSSRRMSPPRCVCANHLPVCLPLLMMQAKADDMRDFATFGALPFELTAWKPIQSFCIRVQIAGNKERLAPRGPLRCSDLCKGPSIHHCPEKPSYAGFCRIKASKLRERRDHFRAPDLTLHGVTVCKLLQLLSNQHSILHLVQTPPGA